MAPKSPKKVKKVKKVMSLADKLKILDLILAGEKISSIARRYGVNESSIRTIRDNKKSIRESAQQLGSHAKVK